MEKHEEMSSLLLYRTTTYPFTTPLCEDNGPCGLPQEYKST